MPHPDRAIALAEFVGTAIVIALGNGVVANTILAKTKGRGGGWILITVGWAMAVFVAVACVGDVSGAHLNPAVTIASAMAGKLVWRLVPLYLGAQMLGAMAGAALVYVLYRDHFLATDDADTKLACFATSPAIRNPVSNLLSEIVGTFVLILAIFMMAAPSFELDLGAISHQSPKFGLGALGALPVGLLIFSIGLSLGGTTGYAINPARDLGPRIVHALLPIRGKRDSDWGYAWIPIVGPIIGAMLAVAVAKLVQ
jgi:glycerol uptake facilitator protein